MRIDAHQVFANCPKYIQARRPRQLDHVEPAVRLSDTQELTAAQRDWITRADTFFVATRSADGDADASHRGGNPGFVRVRGDTDLDWPDYVGNAMLMTLGNLEQDPAAGLLFVDWDSGATLQLSGRAAVDWDPAGALPDAQRVVSFHVERAVEISHTTALAWSTPALSRHNPTPTVSTP